MTFTGAKKGKVDPFLGYRAGALRALVCGEEAATGKYPILNSYTRLLICGVKVIGCSCICFTNAYRIS